MLKPNLYFLFFDYAFFWDRASTIYQYAKAGASDFVVKTLFDIHTRTPDSFIPVLNRHHDTIFFKILRFLFRQFSIPYIADIDDNVWELPDFSSDEAKQDSNFIDSLLSNAALITTTNEAMKQVLAKRFPQKPIFIITNALPAIYAKSPSLVIANTDSFKMDLDKLAWFSKILEEVFNRGVNIQLIGSNQNLVKYFFDNNDHCFHYYNIIPELKFSTYLKLLAAHQFNIGLIPVDNSPYADCKSDIKVQELMTCCDTVIASDIQPYQQIKNNNSALNLQIVENTEPAWREAVFNVVHTLEVKDNVELNKMLMSARNQQFNDWLLLLNELSKIKIPANTRLVGLFIEFYLRVTNVFRVLGRRNSF